MPVKSRATSATKRTRSPKTAASTTATIKKTAARNTSSGKVFEAKLARVGKRNKYTVTTQVPVPDFIYTKNTGQFFRLDIMLERALTPAAARRLGRKIERTAVSAKFQDCPGTVDEKLPLEILRLAELVERGYVDRAFLVLGGKGSKSYPHYLSGNIRVPGSDKILIVSEAGFRQAIATGTTGR